MMVCRPRIVVQALLVTAAFATAASAQPPWATMSLGTLPGGGVTAAEAINDEGAVVGTVAVSGSGIHGFVWTRAGGMTDIGRARPKDINNAGQVVGGYYLGPDGSTQRAFLWTADAGMLDLGTLPGTTESIAYAINDAGWVVGVSQIGSDLPSPHAFLWTPTEGMVDLGGWQASAYDINNSGQVVGAWNGIATPRPFLWTRETGMISLDTPGAECCSAAVAINNAGQVLVSRQGGTFLWTEASGMIDVTRPDSFASGINDAGQIVGSRGGVPVLWTPAGTVDLPWDPTDPGIRSAATGINTRGEIVGWSRRSAFPAADTGSALLWHQRDEAAAFDFPGQGTWVLSAEGWTMVHGLNPIAMVSGDLDANGIDDLVMDFGPDLGLWAWMNQSTWLFLHHLSPSRMIVGDLDVTGGEEIIATFPGAGMWRWADGDWVPFHPLDGIPLAIGQFDRTRGNDLLVDFPGHGLYLSCNDGYGGQVWSRPIGTLSPSAVVLADLDGDGMSEIVASFTGSGVWAYRYVAGTWTRVHGLDAAHLAAGEIDQTPGMDVVIDFGPQYGIWVLHNGTTWSQLHTLSAESLAVVDRDGSGIEDVIVDFGAPYGVWEYANDSTWSLLHPVSPGRIAAGRFY
jgi:probable HAF family extracellular repeat protein